MKNLKIGSIIMIILGFAVLACSFSTANLSSLKTSKDREGKQESSSFKGGETLYAEAVVSNNGGKVKVKFYLIADDVKGLTKGETLKGSEVSVDIEGDRPAIYNVPVTPGFLPGTYTLHADMINEAGEKKDNKSAKITVAGGNTPNTGENAPKTEENISNTGENDTDE